MPLSENRVRDYCCPNGGRMRCIYLYEEQDNDETVNQCAKLCISKRNYIDALIQAVVDKYHSEGIDPTTLNIPLGSNCPGVLRLKYTFI
jgi:hypothetical protein